MWRWRKLFVMDILPVTDEALKRAAEVIKSGGVVAHATETCYGLACDMTNLEAVKKLFAIKNRPDDMPVSALFSSIDEAKKWAEWSEIAQDLAEKYLPGPLTIVLKVGGACASPAGDRPRGSEKFVAPRERSLTSAAQSLVTRPRHRGAYESVGIRISSHPVAQHLSELCPFPISTTSANLHGEPNPYSAEEIVSQFSNRDEKPDLVLDSGALPKAESSTVVIVKDGRINVVRQGSVQISPNP